MTTDRPPLRDILARAWEIRPNLSGSLLFVIAFLILCWIVGASTGGVLVGLAVLLMAIGSLTLSVAAAQLQKEADGGND